MIVLMGLPGAGKTTYANRTFRGKESFVISAWDICPDSTVHEKVKEAMIMLAYRFGKEPIVDSANLLSATRRSLVKLARENGDSVDCHFIDTPTTIAEERHRRRSDRRRDVHPYKIYVEMMEPPEQSEGFDRIVTIDG